MNCEADGAQLFGLGLIFFFFIYLLFTVQWALESRMPCQEHAKQCGRTRLYKSVVGLYARQI